MYQQLIDKFIQQEQLPASYAVDARDSFLPLLTELEAEIRKPRTGPFLLGINGAQGTGKSTLAKLLSALLQDSGFRVANLSIDDFYFSKPRRKRLAEQIHPLLRARGVPGTHDVRLALHSLKQLANADSEDSITLPAFDKSTDDCVAPEDCLQISGPVDLVILEGWFVGVAAQNAEALLTPINELEKAEDKDGRWRNYVNEQLEGDYQLLFAQLKMLVMLEAPGFEQVFEWRSLQEEKLRQHAPADASGLMDEQSLARFIQHFERLTRHCLQTLPAVADHVFSLDTDHRIRKSK